MNSGTKFPKSMQRINCFLLKTKSVLKKLLRFPFAFHIGPACFKSAIDTASFNKTVCFDLEINAFLSTKIQSSTSEQESNTYENTGTLATALTST